MLCVHQPGTPCSELSQRAISLWVWLVPPHSSRSANHSAWPLPVRRIIDSSGTPKSAGSGSVGDGSPALRISCWRAAVYDSPVFDMRARTRPLKTFWVGIVSVFLLERRRRATHARAARREGRTILPGEASSPLPHRAGGVSAGAGFSAGDAVSWSMAPNESADKTYATDGT